jgi:predicted kinase
MNKSLIMNTEKILILVRGLPGSGKSSFAKTFADIYFEADMYFEKDGEYKFEPSKIKDAHSWCQDKVETSMIVDIPKIAVSNTFTQEWEMEHYYTLAKKYNYKVFSVIVENRHNGVNEHGVPEDKIEVMKNRFEISL